MAGLQVLPATHTILFQNTYQCPTASSPEGSRPLPYSCLIGPASELLPLLCKGTRSCPLLALSHYAHVFFSGSFPLVLESLFSIVGARKRSGVHLLLQCFSGVQIASCLLCRQMENKGGKLHLFLCSLSNSKSFQ